MTVSDEARLLRFQQILSFDYFQLKPGVRGACLAHPDTKGAIFPTGRNLSLLNAWLSRECVCDPYGVSKIRLDQLVEKGEIWREVETDPA